MPLKFTLGGPPGFLKDCELTCMCSGLFFCTGISEVSQISEVTVKVDKWMLPITSQVKLWRHALNLGLGRNGYFLGTVAVASTSTSRSLYPRTLSRLHVSVKLAVK